MKRSKTLLFSGMTIILVIGFGFFLTSKWWGGDDSLVRHTWESNYFYDTSYRVELEQVTYDLVQHEVFFVVNQSKVDSKKTLKLQVDVIGQDDYLYPVQTFSHLENEALTTDELKQTAYSFSMPLEDWRYIRFMIQTESEDGTLSNQTVLYADYRLIEMSETPLTLMDFLTTETESSDEASTPSEEAPTTEPTESNTDLSDSSTEEEALQQQYVIESEPIILDGNVQEENHQHEMIETEEPVYTLEDYQHQEQKLNEEIANVQSQLTEQADNQELQQQLAELQMKLADVQQNIQSMKGE